MTDTYLRSRIDTLDEAFSKLQRRKRMKLVKVPDPRLARWWASTIMDVVAHRGQMLLLAGKVVLGGILALTAIATIASGRLGWTNYWGGFVYAPFALVVAVLLGFALIRRRDVGESRPRRRRE